MAAIQAAKQAVHSDTPTGRTQVHRLYGRLMAFAPSPVVALNRAVAETDGPTCRRLGRDTGAAQVDGRRAHREPGGPRLSATPARLVRRMSVPLPRG